MGVESAHTPIDGATLVAAATRIVDYAANHGLVGWADRVWGANAVLEAVERRDISLSRYNSYLSMLDDKEEDKYRKGY